MTAARLGSNQSFLGAGDQPPASNALPRSKSEPIKIQAPKGAVSPYSPQHSSFNLSDTAVTADDIDRLFHNADPASLSAAAEAVMLRRVTLGREGIEEEERVRAIFAKQHPTSLSSSVEDRMKGCNEPVDRERPEVEALPHHQRRVSGAGIPESDLSSRGTASDVDDDAAGFTGMMSPDT